MSKDEQRKRGDPLREAKLAEALRANLRRRKVATRAEPADIPAQHPKDEGSD
jgi:hypothetical protein